eukprot:TRINITY_DN96610_c0_g1_i1.p1 TRINITY_DN96610_c0_g1~~TRINITY_DN96610_c0_g1_i1.p1  ORF type:complete len:580 (-),score=191.03 TRINITY_DN96610_c0_g1_i1:95-1834(-)
MPSSSSRGRSTSRSGSSSESAKPKKRKAKKSKASRLSRSSSSQRREKKEKKRDQKEKKDVKDVKDKSRRKEKEKDRKSSSSASRRRSSSKKRRKDNEKEKAKDKDRDKDKDKDKDRHRSKDKDKQKDREKAKEEVEEKEKSKDKKNDKKEKKGPEERKDRSRSGSAPLQQDEKKAKKDKKRVRSLSPAGQAAGTSPPGVAAASQPDVDADAGAMAAARATGPKLAFGFAKAERGKPRQVSPEKVADGSSVSEADRGLRAPMSRAAVDELFSRHRGVNGSMEISNWHPSQDDPMLRERKSFMKEELCILMSLSGSGLDPVIKAASSGSSPEVSLSSVLSQQRMLGLAEKVLLKAVLEPPPPPDSSSDRQRLTLDPDLVAALGLTVATVAATPRPSAASTASVTPPPPPPAIDNGSSFTLPPPPPTGAATSSVQSSTVPAVPAAAVAAAAATMPQGRIVPLSEWPAPSPEGVQQILARFTGLDGHCRGTVVNLPPQFALAILWDMDAKGGPEAIRDPQKFIFSAAQTLQRQTSVAAMQVPPSHLMQAPGTTPPPPPPPPPMNFAAAPNQMQQIQPQAFAVR